MTYSEVKDTVSYMVADPKYFWPYFWSVLEILALTNPVECKKFIDLLYTCIPCHKCRANYSKHVSSVNGDDMFEFVVNLHNVVNWNSYTAEQRLLEIKHKVELLKLL